MARKPEIRGSAGSLVIGSAKHSKTGSPPEKNLRSTLRDVAYVGWKEDRIWSSIFVVFCALMAAMMWAQSQHLWTDIAVLPRILLRLIAPVTVFVLPILVYVIFKWWTRRR